MWRDKNGKLMDELYTTADSLIRRDSLLNIILHLSRGRRVAGLVLRLCSREGRAGSSPVSGHLDDSTF